MAVIIFTVSFTNSDIFNSKWQFITLLLFFVKYLNRAASENFRSACYLIRPFNVDIDAVRLPGPVIDHVEAVYDLQMTWLRPW